MEKDVKENGIIIELKMTMAFAKIVLRKKN